jgi:hypothetical protein
MADPVFKSNQCYFGRHDECWMSKLCECKCHQGTWKRWSSHLLGSFMVRLIPASRPLPASLCCDPLVIECGCNLVWGNWA